MASVNLGPVRLTPPDVSVQNPVATAQDVAQGALNQAGGLDNHARGEARDALRKHLKPGAEPTHAINREVRTPEELKEIIRALDHRNSDKFADIARKLNAAHPELAKMLYAVADPAVSPAVRRELKSAIEDSVNTEKDLRDAVKKIQNPYDAEAVARIAELKGYPEMAQAIREASKADNPTVQKHLYNAIGGGTFANTPHNLLKMADNVASSPNDHGAVAAVTDYLYPQAKNPQHPSTQPVAEPDAGTETAPSTGPRVFTDAEVKETLNSFDPKHPVYFRLLAYNIRESHPDLAVQLEIIGRDAVSPSVRKELLNAIKDNRNTLEDLQDAIKNISSREDALAIAEIARSLGHENMANALVAATTAIDPEVQKLLYSAIAGGTAFSSSAKLFQKAQEKVKNDIDQKALDNTFDAFNARNTEK